MKAFSFKGFLPASKSLLNRALIAKSYSLDLHLTGDSQCDDVQLMRQGLRDLFADRSVDCGHAGTVLRFLALRASRVPGRHLLTGSERLFSRPQEELLPILGQLGADASFSKNSLMINSQGWRLAVDGLQVNAQRSSQFASAVILNAWELKFPLHFHVSRKVVSEGYLRMTVELTRRLGMRIEENGSEFFIPANQKISRRQYDVEPDVSSAFAVAAMAVVAGEARIQDFPAEGLRSDKSLQPDIVFVEILRKMGAQIQLQKNELLVTRSKDLRGVEVNIEKSPDLLPVLAVLCGLAVTPSHISGVGHLRYKESSRLEKTKELLEMMGVLVEADETSVRIFPSAAEPRLLSTAVFDVDQDHRMAMAATVARWAGYPIHVNDMNAVTKSFPEFSLIAGENL